MLFEKIYEDDFSLDPDRQNFEPLIIKLTLETFGEVKALYKAVHAMSDFSREPGYSGWSIWSELEAAIKQHLDESLLK